MVTQELFGRCGEQTLLSPALSLPVAFCVDPEEKSRGLLMRSHHHSFRHVSMLGGPVIVLKHMFRHLESRSPFNPAPLTKLRSMKERGKAESPHAGGATGKQKWGKKEKTQVNE